MEDALVLFKLGTGVLPGASFNIVDVTNVGAGLWDVVFAYKSRTADVERFIVRAHLALGDVGGCDGAVTALGATTVTVRVNTRNLAAADANKSFNCSIKEMG